MLSSIIVLFIAVVMHEYAHGWVAYKLGDPTAKNAGRLTLNPLVHIDPMGTIFLPFMLVVMRSPFIIGWAKPVPVNFSRLNNPKTDMIWVGLAGPGINIIVASVCSIILKLRVLSEVTTSILVTAILINVLLAVFNALPVPPLDGSRIVAGLLPQKYTIYYYQIEKYGFLIIIILLYTGIINRVVWPIVMNIVSFMVK